MGYYQRTEAEWDVEKRIEKGRKQFAVPAKSVEEFAAGEVKMVDALLTRLKEKATKEGKVVPKDDDDGEAEVEPPKKKKKEAVEDPAEEADDEEAAAKKAKKEKKEKKRKKQEEEEDEE